MRIVVLDGHTLNPGDLDWSELETMGDVTIHPRTAPGEVVERCAQAEAVLLNKVPFPAQTIERLPGLRYVGVLATGYNVVDVAAATAHSVTVTNVPTYGTRSVAQFTIALLLELCHHAGHHAASVQEGRWASSPDFCYWDSPLIELDGLTLGIVGYGRIGSAVSQLARAFGLNVLVHTLDPVPDDEVEAVSLEALFARSDVVTLHAPLTADNEGMVDRRLLELMKPSAFLINTARGQLVNEQDLADALNAGRIAGAALDVLQKEPPKGPNPLLTAKNCLITPHIAWATGAARKRLMGIAVDNLRAFLAGQPKNVVS
jgi:glycerate dehydrogenase